MIKLTRRETIAGILALSSQMAVTTSAIAKNATTKEGDDVVLSSASSIEDITKNLSEDKRGFSNFLDNNTLLSGVLVIPAGEKDTQTPHGLDEIYVVMNGKATFIAGDKEYPVQAGSILFAKAGVKHNFVNVEEHLQVVVIFSKADSKKPPYYERKR